MRLTGGASGAGTFDPHHVIIDRALWRVPQCELSSKICPPQNKAAAATAPNQPIVSKCPDASYAHLPLCHSLPWAARNVTLNVDLTDHDHSDLSNLSNLSDLSDLCNNSLLPKVPCVVSLFNTPRRVCMYIPSNGPRCTCHSSAALWSMINSTPTIASSVRVLGRKMRVSYGRNCNVRKALVFEMTTPDNSSSVWASMHSETARFVLGMCHHLFISSWNFMLRIYPQNACSSI